MSVEEKKFLRAKARAAVGAFTGKPDASERISDLLRTSEVWREARVIYGYAPLSSEPDWLGALWPEEKRLALPKIAGLEMTFVAVSPDHVLERGLLGFREPSGDTPAAAPDLILVPGLAFDTTGVRLGRGGGYYDRWLGRFGERFRREVPHLRLLGVCFACQIVERLPREQHDVPMDMLLTEAGFLRVPRAGARETGEGDPSLQ